LAVSPEPAIARADKVLEAQRKENPKAFQILVMMLYDLNVTNFRVKNWMKKEPVQNLLKYDLPLTYMDPTDPMIYEYAKFVKETKIIQVLLEPNATYADIEKEWDKYSERFKKKKEAYGKIYKNLGKAFKVDDEKWQDRCIFAKLRAIVWFDKTFWEKNKETPRLQDLAKAMLALHADNIKDAKMYFEKYKQSEYIRLPEMEPKDGDNSEE